MSKITVTWVFTGGVIGGMSAGSAPNEGPSGSAARGHFVLKGMVGATGFEPATS